ncbi:MAG: iron-containing alcohol dehydrogenase [Bacteroidales bacterium]|nr:iron-containing alcohol dehydrogenase [Bacteroidales bacterium]MBN2697870.1 iron-containing alcohol dehydrogenase [Bacteroidales bacterium]
MIPSFKFSTLPVIHFGAGKRSILPGIAREYGSGVLILTGSSSIHNAGHGEEILNGLKQADINLTHELVAREPSPELVDEIVSRYRHSGIEVVVAVGGGSVMDAGKAVSALLLVEYGIKRYLEDIGDLKHPGSKVPFIAMPTTSGTGSEMTKNAVISEVGEAGFKKSLRHDHFIPDHAIIDPEMMISCSDRLTATSGMDAFSQLLESYVSTQSNPFTDALALQGLKQIKKHLLRAYLEGDQNLEARAGMAIAAMFSGITLTNAGLGLVHGFASPLGGYYEIPHGAVCGALLAPVFSMTIDKLIDQKDNPAYKKLVIASKVFSDFKYKEETEYLMAFKEKLDHISKMLELPKLSEFGLNETALEKVIKNTSHKLHPVTFSGDELYRILSSAIG